MDKQKLAMAINFLAENFSLNIGKGYIELMSKYLNLTDTQLNKAMEFFTRQKTLVKLPSLAQWKEAAGFIVENPIDVACNKFIDKVQEYLNSDFIDTDEKNEFNSNLSEAERKALNSLGGISSLWSDLHQDGYKRSLSRILYELKQEFLNSANASNILPKPQKKDNMLSNERIKTLLGDTVKRLN